MSKILTPAEVKEAHRGNVEHAVNSINADLITGRRRFFVLRGIVKDVVAGIEAAGWCTKVEFGGDRNSHDCIAVIEDIP